jgi:two-component system response regulator YesN
MLPTMKVLIVDDEDLVRERFRTLFPLKKHGYELVGEAEDGEEALELCRRYQPDIVITDVVMPGMNGIQLTKQLKEEMPSVKVIILSCHREFDFAQKAIAYGAFDYMLKVRTRPPQLLDVLDRARKSLEQERKQSLEQIQLRYQFSKNHYLLRKQFIWELMQGYYATDSEMTKQREGLKMHAVKPIFVIALLQMDGNFSLREKYSMSDISLLRYAQMKILEEVAIGGIQVDAFLWEDNRIGLWIQGNTDRKQLELACVAYMQNAAKQSSAYMPFTFSAGISDPQEALRPKKWYKAVQQGLVEAGLALDRRFHEEPAKLHMYADVLKHPFVAWSDYREKQLQDLLLSLNVAAGSEQLEAWLYNKALPLIDQVNPQEVVGWLRKCVLEWFPTGADLEQNAQLRLEELESASQVLIFLKRMLLARGNCHTKQSGYSDMVQQAKAYIESHYHESCGVGTVSEAIFISSNYLSHVFKKEMGMTFTDYCTHYRILKAKDMLINSSLKISEISERVGFQDCKYFTRIFRRSTGKSPSSYRNHQ